MLSGISAPMAHQYVERATRTVRTETLIADGLIGLIYSGVRENAGRLFRMLTSARASKMLAYLNYDLPGGGKLTGAEELLRTLRIDLSECLLPAGELDTARKIFERRIAYWRCRPLPADPRVVVSPADAKLLVGSFRTTSQIFLKEKFFAYEELLGSDRPRWRRTFSGGDYAVLRLTPEKYHYNHAPVSGRVADIYALEGRYHSCNPAAVVAEATPFSKNKRVVTVIDTDVPGGSGVGMVALIEVAALMIGDIVQCYSARQYENPVPAAPGMFLRRGQPKSLYRPGSSVDVVLFEPGRVVFDADILANLQRRDVCSRFSENFMQPLVETEVDVRASIARRAAD